MNKYKTLKLVNSKKLQKGDVIQFRCFKEDIFFDQVNNNRIFVRFSHEFMKAFGIDYPTADIDPIYFEENFHLPSNPTPHIWKKNYYLLIMITQFFPKVWSTQLI